MATLNVTVSVAWWVQPYLQSVGWFCLLTGMEPDLDKVAAFALRGFTFSIGSE